MIYFILKYSINSNNLNNFTFLWVVINLNSKYLKVLNLCRLLFYGKIMFCMLVYYHKTILNFKLTYLFPNLTLMWRTGTAEMRLTTEHCVSNNLFSSKLYFFVIIFLLLHNGPILTHYSDYYHSYHGIILFNTLSHESIDLSSAVPVYTIITRANKLRTAAAQHVAHTILWREAYACINLTVNYIHTYIIYTSLCIYICIHIYTYIHTYMYT